MLFHMIQKQLVKANLSFVPMLFHMIQKLYLFTGMYGQSFVPMLFHMIQKLFFWWFSLNIGFVPMLFHMIQKLWRWFYPLRTKFCTHVISHDSKTSNMDFSECFMPHFSVAKSAAHIFDYNIIYLIVNYFLVLYSSSV